MATDRQGRRSRCSKSGVIPQFSRIFFFMELSTQDRPLLLQKVKTVTGRAWLAVIGIVGLDQGEPRDVESRNRLLPPTQRQQWPERTSVAAAVCP